MERKLGITKARKELSRLVDQVRVAGDSIVIERHGRPAAALVPIDVYEQWKCERQELLSAIRQAQQTNVDADPGQVVRDVLEAQQAIRQESAV